MKKLVFKSLFIILLITISQIVFNAFEPVVSGSIAVNQLSDSYDSNANMTIYKSLKQYSFLGYILLIVLVFFKDIKKTLKGDKK